MDILGYFNLDMTGYLTPGTPIHFCLIYPNFSLTLADYFVNISNIYFPTVPLTRHSNLPWGDSDHTSFNNKGYKGIWWFEDINCDSPYIHHTAGSSGCGNNCTGSVPCLGDIIGSSVNNSEQVKVFTQAMVASIATLAIYDDALSAPVNCLAQYLEEYKIKVTWDSPATNTPDHYYIYRDGNKISECEASVTSFIDEVSDYKEYCYKITAIYDGEQSSPSNQSCAAVPQPPTPPTHCVAEYIDVLVNLDVLITWDPPQEASPNGYFVYRNEENITTTPITATSFTDTSCNGCCYKITAVYGEEESDFSNEACVPFIDNILEYNSNIKISPNPTNGELQIMNYELRMGDIEIYDVFGKNVFLHTAHRTPNTVVNVSHLLAGIYIIKIGNEFVGKFVKE
jgi:hypothetical protein